MNTKNTFAMLLFIAGIAVIVLGIIGSIVLGRTYADGYYSEFNGTIFFTGLVTTLITGFLILGLAELIRLADESRDYLKKIANNESVGVKASNNSNASSISSQLPEI